MNEELRELYMVLRLATTLGYIATGTLIIAVLYKGFNNYFQERAKKNRWIFAVIMVVVSFLLIYIYVLLFTPGASRLLEVIKRR